MMTDVAKKILEDKINELEKKLQAYEQNGAGKLYYALQRKANEMAELLNKINLTHLDISDKNDKTFERMKVIWNDSTNLSTAIRELGMASNITKSEVKASFLDQIADKRD